jgi:hypothetical protein
MSDFSDAVDSIPEGGVVISRLLRHRVLFRGTFKVWTAKGSVSVRQQARRL